MLRTGSINWRNLILSALSILTGLPLLYVLFYNHFDIKGWPITDISALAVGMGVFLVSTYLRFRHLVYAIYKAIENRKYPVRYFFIPISYAVIAMAFLSPIASDELVPGTLEFGSHINLIVQAKKAIDEGQFPIRVAPGMNSGYRYPVFQFYSPFPYTIAGLIHKYFSPGNAFVAFRLMVFLALFLSGIFIYRISHHLTGSVRPSYLSGIIYMTAPYFIISINARSAWTEVIAQGILPVTLFYVLKLHATGKQKYMIAASLAWFLLITTHLITFMYAAFFIGILILGISFPIKQNLRSMILSFSPIFIASFLAWFYLEPVLFVSVPIKRISDPAGFNWLTPIYTLLSPVSIPPEPLGGFLSKVAPGLNTAIGWVILLAFAYILYLIFSRDPKWENTRKKNTILGLSGIFLIAFLMTWSPIDFWRFIPSFFYITQYPYRIATHTMWSGAILAAFAINYLYSGRKIPDLNLILGVLIIVMSNASWLNIQNLQPMAVSDAMNASLKQDDYKYQLNPGDSLQDPDLNVDQVKNKCHNQQTLTICDINLDSKQPETLQFPVYYYPGMLDVTVNGHVSEYYPTLLKDTPDVLLGLKLAPGDNQIVIQFTGSKNANLLSLIAWIGMMFWVLVLLIPRFFRPRSDYPLQEAGKTS